MVRTLRSLPHPDSLREHLADVYQLPFTGCVLRRSLVNDVYELTTPAEAFVLKLYAGRALPDIRWEAGLCDHLIGRVATPRVQPLADGAPAGVLATPEGDRPYLLTAFVDGVNPRPPLTDDLYRQFGELVARFHLATENFASALPRSSELSRSADRPRGLDELVTEILPLLSPADAELVQARASYAGSKETDGLSRGICHGDVSLDNVLITPQGLNLHDFDLSGEAFLAADFCGVARTPHWDAFRSGYQRHREIPAADLAAIDWLGIEAGISNLHFHLVRKPLFRGTESRGEGWAAGELTELGRGFSDGGDSGGRRPRAGSGPGD